MLMYRLLLTSTKLSVTSGVLTAASWAKKIVGRIRRKLQFSDRQLRISDRKKIIGA